MPPKPKFTKEEVITAALELVREQGEEALTARELGLRLGASARPIFTLFKSMEEVKAAVVERANGIYDAFCREEVERGRYPLYKTFGMAYVRLAAEEKNLFRLLFMRDRTGEAAGGHDASVLSTLRAQTGITNADAERFHTEMWIFVHGIATMLATSYLEWNDEQVSGMMTDIYEGLKRRYMSE